MDPVSFCRRECWFSQVEFLIEVGHYLNRVEWVHELVAENMNINLLSAFPESKVRDIHVAGSKCLEVMIRNFSPPFGNFSDQKTDDLFHLVRTAGIYFRITLRFKVAKF